MLPRERVAAAFGHQPSDKVPIYQSGFSSRAASRVLHREAFVGGGIQQYRETAALWEGRAAHEEFLERSFLDACQLCETLDLDLVRTSYWRKEERPIRRIDELTFEYAGGDVWRFDPPSESYGCVERPPGPEPDLRRVAEQQLCDAHAWAPTEEDFPELRRALERFGTERAIPGSGVSIAVPREAEWMEATLLSPAVVDAILDAQAIRAVKSAAVMARMGLRYCFGGGDLAGARGPLYSPTFFREHLLSRLSRISDACHAAGLHHLFASDGNLWPIADDLFGRSGVDGFYEVDGSFMPLRRLRERFPRLVLLGGIRSETLHLGTVEEVREETRVALETAKEIGGCVIGCSNQIVAATPERNLWAMMETMDKHRRGS